MQDLFRTDLTQEICDADNADCIYTAFTLVDHDLDHLDHDLPL